MTWKVGDPVVVLSDANRRGGGTSTVVGVGRKWFTIEPAYAGHRPRRFSIADGYERGDGCGGYCRAVTPEHAVEIAVRDAASKRLGQLTSGYSWGARLTAAEAGAISDIIERANARGKQ